MTGSSSSLQSPRTPARLDTEAVKRSSWLYENICGEHSRTTFVSSFDPVDIESTALSSDERSKWIGAFNEKFGTLVENKIWVDDKTSCAPHDRRILPAGIILHVKSDGKADISRFKARPVARGKDRNESEDYDEPYASATSIELVKLIYILATRLRFEAIQLDVDGAFFYALLPESDSIWVRLPKVDGAANANGRTDRLSESLYGIRLSLKLWYSHTAAVREKIAIRRSQNYHCLFISNDRSNHVYIAAYVDNLLVVGDLFSVEKVKQQLSKTMPVRDLGTYK